MRWHSRSAEESRQAAAALGAAIEAAGALPALVIALIGPLGAGKTEWVKGLAEGLGIDPRLVASPTFVIASEYPGHRSLAHVDLYRLESEAALEEAGFRDLLTEGAVVAVEWADRFPSALPADRIEVRIRRADDGAAEEREIEWQAMGPGAWKVVGAWTREWTRRREAAKAAQE